MRALLLGALVGGAVTGVLAWRKKRQLEVRAVILQQGLAQDGDAVEALLAQGGAQLQADLERDARAYAEVVAARAAERVLAEQYYLDLRRLQRLGRVLGQ